MSYSTNDVLMISLQFFYAFGGLILMGSLVFSIIKNQALVNEKRLRFEQDFDVELTSQLAQYPIQDTPPHIDQTEKVADTALRGNAPVQKDKVLENVSGTRQVGAKPPLSKRFVSMGQGVVHKGRANRYRVAARLAARGFNAKDIGHKVGLPQCEVDLIASLNNAYTKGRWKNHQSMLNAIDSFG